MSTPILLIAVFFLIQIALGVAFPTFGYAMFLFWSVVLVAAGAVAMAGQVRWYLARHRGQS